MPLEIVIVRHGQCTGNLADRASYKGDHSLFTQEICKQKSSKWPLTARGIKESELAGDWIRNNIISEFDHYFTSDYVRAVETAEHMNFVRAEWNQDLLLRERKWGGVENMPYSLRNEVFQRIGRSPTEDSMCWQPPNGESMFNILKKIKKFLEKTKQKISGSRILIVSHGAPLQAFRVLQYGIGPTEYIPFVNGKNYIRNCHIFHYFEKRSGNASVPLYSFERSAFLDPNYNWIETVRKI